MGTEQRSCRPGQHCPEGYSALGERRGMAIEHLVVDWWVILVDLVQFQSSYIFFYHTYQLCFSGVTHCTDPTRITLVYE